MKPFIVLLAFGVLCCDQLFAQGNVGIGTNAPASKQSINGNLAVGSTYCTTGAPTDGAIIKGQVGIGTSAPNSSTVLDISATNKGVRFPNVNLTSATDNGTIASPAKGLVVWNTGASWGSAALYVNTGSSTTPSWDKVSTGSIAVSNVTATTNKITLSGTPTGAVLQPFGIDVDETKLTLNNQIGTLSVGKGGTGAATLTGMLKGNGTSAISGVTGTQWGAAYWSDANTVAATAAGTSNTVLHGNTGAAPSYSAVSLSADVTGILPIANGGTGSSTQGWVDLTTNQTAAGTKTWSGIGTFTAFGGGSGSAVISKSTGPSFGWNITGQATDQGWWDMVASGTTVLGRAVNDANNGATNWLQVNRGTGYTISSVTFPNGNHGIGTTSPGALLEVSRGISASQLTGTGADVVIQARNAASGVAKLAFASNDIVGNSGAGTIEGWANANGGGASKAVSISFPTSQGSGAAQVNGNITFSTNNNTAATLTEAMRITSTANVGIGTTDPKARLHIVAASGTSVFAARFSQSNATNGNSMLIGLGTENAAWSKGAIGFVRTGSFDVGDITFNLNNTSSSGTDVSTTDERVRIKTNGDIRMTGGQGNLWLIDNGWVDPGTTGAGIAVDNSSYKQLMIVGNNISGNEGQGRQVGIWDYLKVNGNERITGNLYMSDQSYILPYASGHYVRIGSASLPMQDVYSNQFYNTGKSFFGGSSSPVNIVDVYGGMSTNVGNDRSNYLVGVRNTSNGGGGIYISTNNASNSGRWLQLNVGSSEQGCLYNNGGSGASLYSASDRRLKTNIRNTEMDVNALMKIKVRDYTWKATGQQVTAGFIAQELYEVYPDAVLKGSDGELDSAGTWMVNYSGLTPLMVKSIQDLYRRVELLEKENKVLKAENAEIADMKNRIEVISQRLNIKSEE
jgi:hypothetical protein